ncbi:hypothetical protein MMC07_001607 [Pseudocyphellaria aurata]|nr:hypothetical protein [Pseudocyphellaria aurata]
MDDLTNEIVLSLQLDDLNRLLDAATPVQDQRDVTDSQLALVAYRDELALRLDFLRDRRMGRSIARAVLQDDTALREARAQENGAIRDRLTASHLGGVRHIPHPPPLIDLTDGSDDVAINGFSRFNAAPQNPGPIEIGPTTTRPLRHQPHLRSGASLAPPRSRSVSVAQPVRSRESLFGVWKTCVACNEEVSYTCAVYSPCGHDYCKDCAKQIFVNATRDEALFPPRCCRKTIPLAAVDVFLTHEFIEHFRAKSVEFTTPNRTYCSWPTCSTFIPPSSINGETAVCPKCGYWVCTMCKGATHQGRDCPEDGALKNLVATAHVTAEPNSATSVLDVGRHALVRNGTNNVSSITPTKLQTSATVLRSLSSEQHKWMRFKRCFESITTAIITTGVESDREVIATAVTMISLTLSTLATVVQR